MSIVLMSLCPHGPYSTIWGGDGFSELTYMFPSSPTRDNPILNGVRIGAPFGGNGAAVPASVKTLKKGVRKLVPTYTGVFAPLKVRAIDLSVWDEAADPLALGSRPLFVVVEPLEHAERAAANNTTQTLLRIKDSDHLLV